MLAKGAETLPNQIAKDYKALAKFYDAKNFKKGLKNAEKILQSHPDHPETNSMKALFELELGDEAKAEKTAKFALIKSMMKSMFCWHTYGSILKRRKNFAEAAKCFEQSLKFQKDNMQILRQTAALQIQVRDHEGHVNTRRSILKLKSNMLYNWAAFAVAHHLKGDFDELYKVLSSLETMRLTSEMKPIQLSHYFIYRAIAYRDGEKFDIMRKQLIKNKTSIKDQDLWNQLMFKCCLKLGKKNEAQEAIEFLVKKYPQNNDYIRRYQKFKQLTPREVYKKLITDFGSKIAKVYELTVIEDKEQFTKAFDSFIRPYYIKNLISLFAQIQIVYERTSHEDQIEKIFLSYEQSLKDLKYPDGSAAAFPTQYLWSLYLLAQHYSRKFETLQKAHSYICRAIQHTNTVSEFYLVKAQIEYKMHNNFEALKTVNEARKTDLADRYMNNICIKYLMKCMKPNIAEDVLKLFMRDEASLYELQNQWYIIQAGKSFLKMRKFQPGLRHLNFIEKQFIDMSANQYDFHTYCIRKWTLKQYVEYIAFNDNIYQNKKYMEAAAFAIKNLFQYEEYLKKAPKEEEETQEEKVSKKKKKKNKKNQQQEPEQLPPVQAFRKKIDYFGKEYAESIKGDPLTEALTYAKNVLSARYVNKSNIAENKCFGNAFSQAIRVFIHFNKPLMVIRAHKKLIKTNYDEFSLYYWTLKVVRFLKQCQQEEKQHALVKQNIKEYLKELLGAQSPADYHLVKQKQLPQIPTKDIRLLQNQLALNGKDSRESHIQLYKSQLEKAIQLKQKDLKYLQRVFYLAHHLEFYGQFSQNYKKALNEIYGEMTTYFTEWESQIDKLPQSTWSLFWLSDYDQKRQQELLKLHQQKQEQKNKKAQEQKK